MSAWWYGVAAGIALSWLVRHLDGALGEYRGGIYDETDDGPLGKLYVRAIVMPTWRVRRQTSRLARDVVARVTAVGPIAHLLRRRRWRVVYLSVCLYGPDPDQGGAPTRVMTYSWHWTRRGADWHRTRHPNYTGFGSFRAVTDIERAPAGPYDPSSLDRNVND